MNSYYIYDTKNGYFNAVALFGKKGPKRAAAFLRPLS
uniref:Uncharacterized protein n=1 Tax=viral metagenome TaxID=1070528 RepID=A0A6C0DEE6_9ZZZZ